LPVFAANLKVVLTFFGGQVAGLTFSGQPCTRVARLAGVIQIDTFIGV
jgi:hypothetical protein